MTASASEEALRALEATGRLDLAHVGVAARELGHIRVRLGDTEGAEQACDETPCLARDCVGIVAGVFGWPNAGNAPLTSPLAIMGALTCPPGVSPILGRHVSGMKSLGARTSTASLPSPACRSFGSCAETQSAPNRDSRPRWTRSEIAD